MDVFKVWAWHKGKNRKDTEGKWSLSGADMVEDPLPQLRSRGSNRFPSFAQSGLVSNLLNIEKELAIATQCSMNTHTHIVTFGNTH